MRRIGALIPAASWLAQYQRAELADDAMAGLIAAALLIPQSIAYAILAGLPPAMGLYASIIPPIVYAMLGTSRTLSVGPFSITALLVASALSSAGLSPQDPAYVANALLLAAMSGGILLLMALLRLGVLVNFLGHPVLSGFTNAAAILIILSQLQNLTGISLPQAASFMELVSHAWAHRQQWQPLTAALGLSSIMILLLLRAPLTALLQRLGFSAAHAAMISRTGPLGLLAGTAALVNAFGFDRAGLAIVGDIPAGLPQPTLDFLSSGRMLQLLPSAVLISLIGYIGSISVARVLAYRRRQRLDNDQELLALGAANLAAAVSGSMPVSGSISRSMVNFTAGARTQLASIITALLVGLAAFFFTPLFYYLPKAALAAIIVVAVLPLIDWRMAVKTYRYDPADAAALAATFLGVLTLGIQIGLLIGLALSIGSFLWRSSHPHVAIVGRVPGTQHFRNIDRHKVETWPQILLLRIDRSLYFANVSHIEDIVATTIAEQAKLKHLVLIASAINTIDYSAVESLEQLAANLRQAGVTLHLAEVKGPVMDRLRHTDLMAKLAPGRVFLSTEEAVEDLTGERAA
jgi:SulP family sulfate permease